MCIAESIWSGHSLAHAAARTARQVPPNFNFASFVITFFTEVIDRLLMLLSEHRAEFCVFFQFIGRLRG